MCKEILTELEFSDSLKRYYDLQHKKETLSGLNDIEEAEYEQLSNDILTFEDNR